MSWPGPKSSSARPLGLGFAFGNSRIAAVAGLVGPAAAVIAAPDALGSPLAPADSCCSTGPRFYIYPARLASSRSLSGAF